MNVFRVDLFWHAWVVHAALADWDGEAKLDMGDFSLEVRARNRYFRFYPQFIVRNGEQLQYVQKPDARVRGFAGWLPYFNKRWPAGSGKFAFKDFCAKNALRTPRFWRAGSGEVRDFLVKQDQSSFARGMRGPFKAYQPQEPGQALGDGGYYEQFVRGESLKAWYWEDRLAAVESHDMPAVTGDGASRLRELIQRGALPDASINWERSEDLARYQDLSLDTVLAKGKTALADITFTSPMRARYLDTGNSLERCKDKPFLEKLRALGATFWQAVPEDIRPATLYTIDAVADTNGEVWLLEMNCNPALYPDVYPFAFETLFGPRKKAGTQAAAATAPLPPADAALPRPGMGHPGQARPGSMWLGPPPGVRSVS